jgi:hypothetical protein
VSLANRMAIASSSVRAMTVEANEFPRLARDFQVSGVPRTVVNRGGAFVGAMPEEQFVSSALKLAGVAVDEDAEGDEEPPEVEPV